MTDREKILNYLKDCSCPTDPAQRKDLVQLIDSNDRTIRDIVSNLQFEGYPIYAAGKGYYYAHKKECDIKLASKYICSEFKRGDRIIKKAKKLYATFKKELNQTIPSLEEQPTLF